MEQSAEAETEPNAKGELKSHYEGSHSPFGLIWQIASATGWSVDYILWGINYQTLVMMLADAPRFVNHQHDKKVMQQKIDGQKNNPKSVIGFFQSFQSRVNG